jgi:hypothetical protein
MCSCNNQLMTVIGTSLLQRGRLGLVAIMTCLVLAAQASDAHGGWQVTASINPMDSVKTVSASMASLEDPNVNLVVRCIGKRAAVYVSTHETISAEYGVRIRFDKGRPVKQSWQRAKSYDSLFAPSAGDFLRNMKSARIFYFEYTPDREIAKGLSFDVGKLPEDLYTACVTAEIEKATEELAKQKRTLQDMEAKDKQEQEENAKHEKQDREENEKRLDALQTKCSPFADETVEQVERSLSPLPPQECWEVLEWMHRAASYEELAKRRDLCKLPSFANDPTFCGARSGPATDADKTSMDKNDQKLIVQSLNDPDAITGRPCGTIVHTSGFQICTPKPASG